MNTNDDQKLCPAATEDRPATTLSRRRLLRIAGTTTGLVVIGAIPACNATGSPPTGPVGGGNVSALDVGTMLVIANIVVGRDANGVYAMSAICTHQGCYVSDNTKTIAAGLYCGCHGSAFDGDGHVTHGPASQPLQHYAVAIDANGDIIVDGSQPVADGTRTPA